ncbi:hypothetical protein MMC07_009897 [Pseudocyphellaria aurata]|nr:hypothetical protein [Pseudocyphellaria aurata]
MSTIDEFAPGEQQNIAKVQEEAPPKTNESRNAGDHRESNAARTLQRTYRGHRERRQLKGITLDPATRWTEAVKEAQYRSLTTPRPRSASTQTEHDGSRNTSEAHQHWLRAAKIARRAGGVDEEEVSSSSSNESETPSQKQARREKRLAEKQERISGSKMMDLQYFLEMVDLKHRYGSNLRTYHAEWKRQSTLENFFYWLDYGEGKEISLPTCPRERLDREQVRYLSREERLDYLATVNKEGKLCWKRNGERIDTSVKWKDSVHGIVPVEDTTPGFTPASAEAARSSDSSSEDSSDEGDSSGSDSRKDRYVNHDLKKSKGPKKLLHVSPATIFNQLLRTSSLEDAWQPERCSLSLIQVADTSFNLYIGIKQSGSFQHSSFLHGSRISAAGLIKVKDGQVRSLSPLRYRSFSSSSAFIIAKPLHTSPVNGISIARFPYSCISPFTFPSNTSTSSTNANPPVLQPRSGHYRPPSSNFRAFIRTLEDRGVDMSAMTVSKSYAVLLGLEGYAKTRKKLKDVGKFFGKGKDDGEGSWAGGGRKHGVKDGMTEKPDQEGRRGTETGGAENTGEERVLAMR